MKRNSLSGSGHYRTAAKLENEFEMWHSPTPALVTPAISAGLAMKQRVTAIRCISFLVRSFATPCADYSASQWGINTVRRGRRLLG